MTAVSILSRFLADDDDKPCRGRCPRRGTVVTSAKAPARGPLAWALACAAHMAVTSGRAWNRLPDPHMPIKSTRRMLADVWEIRTPAEWYENNEWLLRGGSAEKHERALSLRSRDWAHNRRLPDLVRWEQIIVSSGASREDLAVPRRVAAYERALARDGVIAPHGAAHSVLAYDWSRAIDLADSALLTNLIDTGTAESAIVRAGRLCADHYASWEDFSAGYCLGRVLAFDHDAFGEMYHTSVLAHRQLANTPHSPWRTLRWADRA
jgi:uncharacterized protein DUF1266